MREENIICEKSENFAVRVVKLYRHLRTSQKEMVISKQLLRSGTSIGANIAEAQDAQSKMDFISKLSISLKECNESKYWLRLLYRTNYLSEKEYESIMKDCTELYGLLTAIIKSTKSNINSKE